MNALDVLTYGQSMVMATVDRYQPEDWTRNALGVWTAKDLLGHLSVFEVRLADVLATFVGAPVESNLLEADPETFNDDQAAIRNSWTVQQVRDEFVAAYDRAMTHARAIPPETWRQIGAIPWYGPEYSLDDFVVYNIYGHKREHDPQLNAALEGPGA